MRIPVKASIEVIMLNRFLSPMLVALLAAAVFPIAMSAQNYPKVSSPDGWPTPSWEYPPLTPQAGAAARPHRHVGSARRPHGRCAGGRRAVEAE
jgi:hypothetical protein